MVKYAVESLPGYLKSTYAGAEGASGTIIYPAEGTATDPDFRIRALYTKEKENEAIQYIPDQGG